MNTVIDLSARSVSFILLMQDVYLSDDKVDAIAKHNLFEVICSDYTAENFKNNIIPAPGQNDNEQLETFRNRAAELVWISKEAEDKTKAVDYAAEITTALAGWMKTISDDESFNELRFTRGIPTPYAWRNAIGEVLYKYPDLRITLATVLQYLPVQVVLAAGGSEYDAQEQRVLQAWKMNEKNQENLLNKKEQTFYNDFTRFTDTATITIDNLLKYDHVLKDKLLKSDPASPLSFELILNDELEEIVLSRRKRKEELSLQESATQNKEPEKKINNPVQLAKQENDPYEKAGSMNLYAMTLSGGGIRSATFNLGILQGLSMHGLLSEFDYLSTVSGGGYIGSWLVAWIKRTGSVSEVADRLNPDKSPDPFAEEVRPIQWLRMFSNFLNPDSGIMSVDSWTIGITFLRNTMLNMVIILLLMLTLLFAGRFFFVVWDIIGGGHNESVGIYLAWGVLLLLVSLLTGIGMHVYVREPTQTTGEKNATDEKKISKTGFAATVLSKIFYKDATSAITSPSIAVITIVGAYLVSAWFYAESPTSDKFNLLLVPALFSFIALLIVAALGRYDKCIESFEKGKPQPDKPESNRPSFKAVRIIVFTAIVSAAAGTGALALAWKLLEFIKCYCFAVVPVDNYSDTLLSTNDRVAFTVGIPLLMLAFGVTIVTRMALLGRYFPDERREWWGRMGAVVNRNALLWIVIAGSALLGEQYLNQLAETKTGIATPFGAWVALIGTAVRMAFSSVSTGSGDTKGFKATAFDIFGRTAPYLFILGLLFFVPHLLGPIERMGRDGLNFLFNILHLSVTLKFDDNGHWLFILAVLFLVLGSCTYLLARRVGVNEFSMHHFYRNRLIRAYLGATRRRAERNKTANPFTRFDAKDDEKLSSFTVQNGYYGPYPVLNAALNVSKTSELDRQDRKGESFIFSPLYCGFDFSTTRASADIYQKSYDYGYRPTEQYAYPNDKGPAIGTAMAISGAAVNPNMGYHSSPATAFLLTVFNVRLGWWMGNPRKGQWQSSDPHDGLVYLVSDLAGNSDTSRDFVCLSDGGHFDNMGLYEMVRRRCSFIIVGDGEQDEDFTCEGLANAIRKCLIDFGVMIDIDISDIVKRDDKRLSKKHYAIGTIHYPNDEKPGVLLYIKSSLTGNEPVDIREYSLKNESFPHQTTGDQFFTEDQFESYRKLGLYIVDSIFSDDDFYKEIKTKSAGRIRIEKKEDRFRYEFSKAFKKVKNLFT